MSDRPTWNQAQRTIIEVDLACAKCGAANRPGALLIRLEQHDLAVCRVCAFAWHPE